MPSIQAELRSNQKDWTSTGLDCYYSGADCKSCPVYLAYGLHKNSEKSESRCHQPAANKALLAKGKPVPDLTANLSVARITIKTPVHKVESRTQREKQAAQLRDEIVRVLPILETPTMYEVINHMNQSQFLGRGWSYDSVNSQFHKMRKLGIIYTTRHEGRIGYWAVGDTSKLPQLLRNGRRTKEQMRQEKEQQPLCQQN